jgi:hypothetical protein
MRRILVALALVLATAVSHVARAADGALEINQACVATGCFPGDTAGFPVEITSPGSYKLTSNLVVPDANTIAVSIVPDSVSLDLGGFAIQGPTLCTGEPVTSCTPMGSGVGVSAGNRSRIYNGTIQGMGGGGIGSGTDARMWDLTVVHNGSAGIFLSRGGSVRNSTVNFNGERGIRGISGGGFGEVAGCTVRGNKDDGIALSSGLVVDSRIQNNGAEAIQGGGDVGYHGNILMGNVAVPPVSFAYAIGCNLVDGAVVCPP